MPEGEVPLREYVEAVLEEHRKATEMAEREREKAAQALQGGMERAMREGDDRLREHITNQVMQINAALVSAEKLEVSRCDALESRIDSVHNELQIINEASEKAIAKAENATERRFESVNEWRQQSLDRERSQMEQTSVLTGQFLPREVADAQFLDIRRQMETTVAELRRALDEVREKVSQL